MAAKPGAGGVTPKTFFLNERQELSSFDRDGFGRPARYKPINWTARSSGLVKLRPCGKQKALRGSGNAHHAYPLIDRVWSLQPENLQSKLKDKESGEDFVLTDDDWVLELEYEEIGEYPVGVEVRSQQRVGVVLELLDRSETPKSPQALIQALPIATELDRLSVSTVDLQTPILIRS